MSDNILVKTPEDVAAYLRLVYDLSPKFYMVNKDLFGVFLERYGNREDEQMMLFAHNIDILDSVKVIFGEHRYNEIAENITNPTLLVSSAKCDVSAPRKFMECGMGFDSDDCILF